MSKKVVGVALFVATTVSMPKSSRTRTPEMNATASVHCVPDVDAWLGRDGCAERRRSRPAQTRGNASRVSKSNVDVRDENARDERDRERALRHRCGCWA